MKKRTQQRFIAALLMVLLTACQTWQGTAVSPQQLIPVEQPSSVRATLKSGERVTLENPIVRNDSIFGVTDAGVATLAGEGVASEDIGLLEVRRTSILRSIGLGYLIVLVATIPLFVASMGSGIENLELLH